MFSLYYQQKKDNHPFGDPIISFEETVVIRDDGRNKEKLDKKGI
jgi:hypothetical protein